MDRLRIMKHSAGPLKLSTSIGVLAATALLASTSVLFAQGVVRQTVDVVGQGPAGPVVAENGATVTRTKNGVRISVTMPTPEPGSYDYPPSNIFQTVDPVPGTPEVFTGWAFIFNQPENCAVPNQCIPPPPRELRHRTTSLKAEGASTTSQDTPSQEAGC